MGKLTAATLRNASRPGLHGDGATLYLAVAPGGSRSWIQRVTVRGRRRDIGLGGYPAVSLAKANRVAIADGIDPLAGKRRVNTPTFRAAAVATFEANRPRWRAARAARVWMQSLEKHAFPEIGALRVDTITQDDILRIHKPLWSTPPAARPEAAPAHPRHAPVVPGARPRRRQRGGGGHRRGVARDAGGQGALPRTALGGGRRRPRRRAAGIGCLEELAAVPRVPRADRGAQAARRSAQPGTRSTSPRASAPTPTTR